MCENTVFVKHYSGNFPVNTQEIWRYAGYRGQPDDQLQELLDSVIGDLSDKLSCRVCYRVVENFPFVTGSQDLQNLLTDCEKIVIFAATVGLDVDRYIAKYQQVSATRVLLAQAYGAERIEALCDVFCAEFAGATRRFSPGYGDLPLETQRDLFSLLECGKHIGVSLTDSLLMMPTKSVTAIFGIGAQETACVNKCDTCSNAACNYRR